MLGSTIGSGFIRSVKAYGNIPIDYSSTTKNYSGKIYVCVIGNSSNSNGIVLPSVRSFPVKTKNTFNISERPALASADVQKFDNTNNPKKNDYIAVYIPRNPSRSHTLQIAIRGNVTKSEPYAFLVGSEEFDEKNLENSLSKQIKNRLEGGGWSKWKAGDPSIELNIQVKIQGEISIRSNSDFMQILLQCMILLCDRL